MMIKINLNKSKSKRYTSLRKLNISELLANFGKATVVVHILIPAFSIGSVFAYYFYVQNKIIELNGEKQIIVEEIEKYQQLRKKLENLREELKKKELILEEINLKLKVYSTLSSSNSNVKQSLSRIITNLPDGVWLENTTVSNNEILISGYAFYPNQISNYFKSLSTYYLVSFESTEMKVSQSVQYYSFSFKLTNAGK